MEPKRHILITGGTGFIGLGLIDPLLESGWDVTVLTRNPTDAVRVLGTRTRTVVDLHDLSEPLPFEAVVNLAGAPIADRRWTDRRKQELRESRIGVTDAVREYCEEHDLRPRVLVSGSAVGYYGVCGDEWVDERRGPGAGFAAALCAEWEEAAQAFRALDTRVVCLRIGLVFGRGGMLARLRPLFRLGLGGRLGDGSQYMSWIDWRDMTALVLAALDDERYTGPVNAVAPEPVTNAQFTERFAAALRRPARIPVPPPALRLALGPELADELLLGGVRVRPARLEALGTPFAAPDLDSCLAHWFGHGRSPR